MMMTIEPTPPPPPARFSPWTFIGGLLLALVVGGIANVFAGLAGLATNSKAGALLIGALPGIIFALLFIPARKDGFAQGLLIGGCIIALIGGACGSSMVGTSFH
jgi:hypothetical protein